MARKAYLPISADRYTPCIRTFRFRGIDLTGAGLQMSIRNTPDTPGAPIANLLTVTNENEEGLRFTGVDTTGPVPISTVVLKINETTMTAMPYSGEVGDITDLAYDWQITTSYKRVAIAGPFLVLPGVVGANEAPTSRPPSYGRSVKAGAGDWSTANLTFTEETTEIVVDGVDELAPLLADAAASQQAAEAAAAAAAASAGSISGRVQLTQTNVSNAKFMTTMPAGTVVRPFATEFVLVAPGPRDEGDGGVEIAIDGFISENDARQVVREDGSQIETGAWATGQRLRLYFDGGLFRLVEPVRAAAAGASTSEYQLIALSHARTGA